MQKIIEEKQVWRLITCLLLHGNFMHLMVIFNQINLFSQLRLCFTIEKFYKSSRFTLIYFISGLAGNLLSGYLYPDHILVGSSTALFGVFGCYGCYFLHNWHSLGPGRNLNMLIYLFFIVISLELPITLASVEIAGHIGGYTVGFCLGFFLMPKENRDQGFDLIMILNGIAVFSYFAVMIWLLSILKLNN